MGGALDLDSYDALGLAQLVRRGEVDPGELLEATITRIESRNPALNAVITPMFEQARARVREGLPDGPFRGVPLLLKDELAPTAGVRYTRGSKAYAGNVADHDSELVRRWKAAGLVAVGRTNTPELALMATTEPELFGPTRNPWDPSRSPGGSSGGSAAAVAAGLAPMAAGSDMGGSIRIPSSWCGLFGLKPSRGRNPVGPEQGQIWLGLGVEHVLTRSVRDSAAALDVSCGPDPGAPCDLPPPDVPFLEALNDPPRSLRIAFTTTSPLGTRVHPECMAAVHETAQLLEEQGHRVEEAAPDVDGWEAADAWLAICFSQVAREIDRLPSVLGRRPRPRDVEPLTWTMGLLGRTFSAGDLNRALETRDRIGRVMATFHRVHDVLLTPTAAVPPARLGELLPGPTERALLKVVNSLGAGRLLRASGITHQMAETSFSVVPFTPLANLSGQPAASLPLHWTEQGLPCGVMVAAAVGGEALLLRLAAQLEEARPWFHRRPPAFS